MIQHAGLSDKVEVLQSILEESIQAILQIYLHTISSLMYSAEVHGLACIGCVVLCWSV